MSNDIPKLPDNSGVTTQTDNALQPIAKGNIVRSKPNSFLKGNFRSALKSVADNILIPSAQDIVVRFGNSLLSSIIYGDYNRNPGSQTNYNSPYRTRDGRPYTNYGAMDRNTNGYSVDYRRPVQNRTSVYDYQGVEFDNRGDAELVKSTLIDISERQGYVTVLQLMQLSDYPSNPTDNDWGWYDLDKFNLSIYRTLSGKYGINLPQIGPIYRR